MACTDIRFHLSDYATPKQRKEWEKFRKICSEGDIGIDCNLRRFTAQLICNIEAIAKENAITIDHLYFLERSEGGITTVPTNATDSESMIRYPIDNAEYNEIVLAIEDGSTCYKKDSPIWTDEVLAVIIKAFCVTTGLLYGVCNGYLARELYYDF